MTLVHRNPAGKGADEILYRYDEGRLEVVEEGRPWSSTSAQGCAYRHSTVRKSRRNG
jgi:hypothetical protein